VMTSALPKRRRESAEAMAKTDATNEDGPGRGDRSAVTTRHRALVGAVLALALLGQGCGLPDLDHTQARARPLPQTSFLYAGDGSLITSFHSEQNRTSVPFLEIPQVVRDAVVAIEDRRFYDHKGVDLKALIRALYVDAKSGRILQGGSTITEQYIKNRYLGSARTLKRKVQEAYLAWQLEHRLSKNEILTRYLNTVYFGHGAYGIQAAAKTYFSEPASDLNLPQAGLLAGLIRAPTSYEPTSHKKLALYRRNLVLQKMSDYGMISTRALARTVHRRLGLHPAAQHHRYPAPYFVQFVKDWFISNPAFGATRSERESLLYQGGLRIYTSLRPRLQRMAEDAVHSVLVYRNDPYGAMTVIDPQTGEIKAMVGGRDFFSLHDPVAQVNLATGGVTGRQAGSTFKPFALVAALQNGIPPQKVYDAPSSITLALPPYCQARGEPVWPVTNFDGNAVGQLTVEQATIDSVNVVYAQIVRDLGLGDPCAGARQVVATARQLGVNSDALMRMGVGEPMQAVPAAVLGAEQVNTVEMANAYATLATVGYRVTPKPVVKVIDARGRVLYRADPHRHLALTPSVAWVADAILQKVVQSGTGSAANIGRPVIGKTGTSQNYHDAWFVGAVPQLAAAVWVGFPQGDIPMVAPRTRLPQVLGGTWPAQIWNVFMANATRGMPVERFVRPTSEYVTVNVDTSRNCLPNQFTPPYLIQPVTYLVGTEPTSHCTQPTSYQPLAVPSVVGLQQEDAVDVLEGAGFHVDAALRNSHQPAGTVVSQSPAGGEQALQASTVTITVSSGPRQVPCPTDAPSPSASGTPPSPPPSSSPSAGPTPCVTPSGSPSPGPGPTSTPALAKVSVPDVNGLSQGDAVSRLQTAGFGVAVIQKPCTGDSKQCHSDPGVVWKEDPAAGTRLRQGSTVTVFVNP
jgi:penicillin-binding protein 1A